MISSNLIFGQNSTDYYSKTEIAKIIKLKYGFDLEKDNYEVLYIIDKIPYSESDLEKELKKFNKSDIKTIYGFEQEVTKYSASSNNFITILSTQSQERKYKRKKLKELITLFKNSNEIPLLSIDNALIEYSSDYIEILENLKINEIDHIVYITQPLNKDTYPNKGENGIVEILLR
jgi:lipid II:glycine glycyltransferase (peptidoglycan interpeptide bridge formation enzyme)